MNNYFNPYQYQGYNQPYIPNVPTTPKPNMLPPQQILQASGKASIDMLQMSPNSSVLIADTTAPIVWKCVSDGLGNVTSEAFDIVPHKDEAVQEQETLAIINQRLTRLEGIVNEQSTFIGDAEPEFGTIKTGIQSGAKRRKSTGNAKSDDAE